MARTDATARSRQASSITTCGMRVRTPSPNNQTPALEPGGKRRTKSSSAGALKFVGSELFILPEISIRMRTSGCPAMGSCAVARELKTTLRSNPRPKTMRFMQTLSCAGPTGPKSPYVTIPHLNRRPWLSAKGVSRVALDQPPKRPIGIPPR